MIKKIIFEVETITPMFLSGADQEKAELRAASIKGLLRFWWRALQAESDLEKLRERESGIFGSADEKHGASSFSIRISHDGSLKTTKEKFPFQKIVVTSESRGKTFPVNILEYLAFGPCSYDKAKKKNVIAREYIQPGFKFAIYMTIFKEAFIREILMAMYVLDMFGAIGSKSRNGFGSFSIFNKQECFSLISNEVSISDPYARDNLQNLIKRTDSKSYTSFARETRIFRLHESYNSWDKALGEMGKIYRGIRSGDLQITTSDGNQISFEKHFSYDKRQYIGSPIIVDKQDKSFLERHAKPYFIKVVKENNQYRPYILYLPSLYCEGLEKDNLNKPINHLETNKRFKEVCNEFNNFLSENMETIL